MHSFWCWFLPIRATSNIVHSYDPTLSYLDWVALLAMIVLIANSCLILICPLIYPPSPHCCDALQTILTAIAYHCHCPIIQHRGCIIVPFYSNRRPSCCAATLNYPTPPITFNDLIIHPVIGHSRPTTLTFTSLTSIVVCGTIIMIAYSSLPILLSACILAITVLLIIIFCFHFSLKLLPYYRAIHCFIILFVGSTQILPLLFTHY